MLGRLQMTTDEALKAYNAIARAIFSTKNRKLPHKDGAFKATTLELKAKEVVAERRLGDRMLDNGSDGARGKSFVCAIPADNMAYPRHFRSYRVRENANADCMIWEAARATTAAPTFFKRIGIGEEGRAREDFLDGGMRHNNPANHVLLEARAIYGGEVPLGCLLSLGTGHSGTVGLPRPDAFQKMLPLGLVEVLKRIATNCEDTAHALSQRFNGTSDLYFRFTVTHGAGNISLEEWERMREMETHTKAYMEEVSVSASINAVTRILCRANDSVTPVVTLRSICQS